MCIRDRMRASAIIFGALRQVRAPAMAMLEAMSPFLTSAGISTMKAGSSASGRVPSAIACLLYTSCWGRGQQDASGAQRMLGAATRAVARRRRDG